MEFTLLWAALFGVVPLWLVLRFAPLPGAPDDLIDLVMAGAMFGLLVGRIASMIGAGINPLTNPGDIIIVRAGVATGWASVAAIGWLGFGARPRSALGFDAAAPAALIGLAGWHGGCLVRGACLGTATDLPWGFALAGGQVSRHPTELYAAGLLMIVGMSLWLIGRRGGVGVGKLSAIALLAAAGIRLITEPLRPALGAGPRVWYTAAIGFGLAGLAVASWRARRVQRESAS